MAEKEAKRILVVDDEEGVVFFLTNIIERARYEVISATTGKEAIELARKQQPHLIILDIILPDMDGGDVAAALSEDSSTAGIPIIFLSGILTTDEEAEIIKTGNSYMLAKPVEAEKLLNKIQEVLPR
jgi:DNA-binding response OmpR family regulator